MAKRLTDEERTAALKDLGSWRHDAKADALTREWKLGSFEAAFGFMAHVALIAQKADHHPDWSNSYDKVTITLSTHSAGGLTEKDIALAKAIDAIGA